MSFVKHCGNAVCLYLSALNLRSLRVFRSARLPAAARIAAALFIAVPAAPAAEIQTAQENSAADLPQEVLQIIVTTRNLSIGADFSGTDLYIAGTVENMDSMLRRQNRYDIIVALEGENKRALLYKKERRFGVWVNGAAAVFSHVPQFYALASTRELRDIAAPQIYQHLGLGLNFLPMRSKYSLKPATEALYKQELIDLKQKKGLYTEETGSIIFGSAHLFSTKFHLPDNVPVGFYTIKAYLFRDGIFSGEASEQLEIRRTNFAYALYYIANKHALLYGFAAVILALCLGFCGRLIFRK